MPGLKTLKDIYKENGDKFINNLFNSYIIVTEMLDGSKVSIRKVDNKIQVFKRDDRKPINIIDRTLMVYYEDAIKFFDNVSEETLIQMPDNWQFSFQYFPDTMPNKVAYKVLPKNKLVLTNILIKNNSGKTTKVIDDPDILNKWSDMLDVERPPVIFNGVLSKPQRSKLTNLLSTNYYQLDDTKNPSFIKNLIKILNPNINSTKLNNDLDSQIDSIVFKFITGGRSKMVSAKIIDPYMKSILSDIPERTQTDIYSIVLLDIVEFVESINFEDIVLIGKTSDERYIELISELYNSYMDKHNKKYIGVDLESPFVGRKAFKLNLDFIKNQKTINYINQSETNKDLYKIFISSLRKKRRQETLFINFTVLQHINDLVDKIQILVNNPVNENLGLMTFSEYRKVNESTVTPVNVFVGKFQPFTNGHLKVINELYKYNGAPVYVMYTNTKKVSENRPFDNETIDKMLSKISESNDAIIGFSKIEGSVHIGKIFEMLRPTYEPILWGVGEDRFDTFNNQLVKYKDDIKPQDDFKIHKIERDAISSTKVRACIKDGDIELFKSMTPTVIHEFYDVIK